MDGSTTKRSKFTVTRSQQPTTTTQPATTKPPSRYIVRAMLHKLPEHESSTNIKSPYSPEEQLPYEPKSPTTNRSFTPRSILRTASKSSIPKRQKTKKNVRIPIKEGEDGFFSVPTDILLLGEKKKGESKFDEKSDYNDDANRVSILKDEMMYILEQSVGSVLQDMAVFKGAENPDDDYRFSDADVKKITSQIEDILLKSKSDRPLYDLYKDAPYSRKADKEYVSSLMKYVNHLRNNVDTPIYEIVKQAFTSGLQHTYDYLLKLENDPSVQGERKYDKTSIYRMIQKYIESRAAISSLPETLTRAITSYVETSAYNIRNKPHFQTVLLEISKMMCVHLHTKTFEYIVMLVLLAFIAQKSRISCYNRCPPVRSDGFHMIEMDDKDISIACTELYTNMKGILGKYELHFFIMVLGLVSNGKCTLLRLSGGKKHAYSNLTIHTGPRGGKYLLVSGKKKYL